MGRAGARSNQKIGRQLSQASAPLRASTLKSKGGHFKNGPVIDISVISDK